jgi:FAD/FMN-containing dehydrogenase
MKPLLLLLAIPSFSVCSPTNQTTPAGCRKLKSDVDWPAPEVWKAALPGIISLAAKAGKTTPDYRYQPTSIADAQKAVKFATANNVRLAIISTGHDYMARSDSASGLLLDMSKMTKVRALESFTPSGKGADSPGTSTNIIVPKAGVHAAVTFGGGIGTQALNDALAPSKLFTMGAAYGIILP